MNGPGSWLQAEGSAQAAVHFVHEGGRGHEDVAGRCRQVRVGRDDGNWRGVQPAGVVGAGPDHQDRAALGRLAAVRLAEVGPPRLRDLMRMTRVAGAGLRTE